MAGTPQQEIAEVSNYGQGQYGPPSMYGKCGIDTSGPLVHPEDPPNGGVHVVPSTAITVDVTDEVGLKTNSVRIRIQYNLEGWHLAYQQGDLIPIKSGFDGPRAMVYPIEEGLRVILDPNPPIGYNRVVRVEVTAADAAGNPERLG